MKIDWKRPRPFSLWQLARSLQKHVRRLKSVGYSHPPIGNNEKAEFKVLIDGITYLVTVTEWIEPSMVAAGITTLRNLHQVDAKR